MDKWHSEVEAVMAQAEGYDMPALVALAWAVSVMPSPSAEFPAGIAALREGALASLREYAEICFSRIEQGEP